MKVNIQICAVGEDMRFTLSFTITGNTRIDKTRKLWTRVLQQPTHYTPSTVSNHLFSYKMQMQQ